MTEHTIAISGRELLDHLSGDPDRRWPADAGEPNPSWIAQFQIRRREGRLIERVVVERGADEDDDWIIFRFGEPDPAVSAFRFHPEKVVRPREPIARRAGLSIWFRLRQLIAKSRGRKMRL